MSNATVAAALASLNPAQRAEVPYLTTDQLALLLHAPARVLSDSQILVLLLYLYSVGAVCSGAIILAASFNHQMLLKTATDRLTIGLVLTCFVWSVGRAIIHAIQGIGDMSLQNQGAAAFSNVMILIMFTLNSHLAIERYFQVKEQSFKKQILYLLWFFFAITVIFIFWMFSTSVRIPTSDGLKPDNSPQQAVWLTLLCGQYLATSLTLAYFYTCTYRHSTKQMAEDPQIAAFFLKQNDGMTDDPRALEL
ncbi:hypothetical protein HDU82_002749, partial [Entophlyctis luteolus]